MSGVGIYRRRGNDYHRAEFWTPEKIAHAITEDFKVPNHNGRTQGFFELNSYLFTAPTTSTTRTSARLNLANLIGTGDISVELSIQNINPEYRFNAEQAIKEALRVSGTYKNAVRFARSTLAHDGARAVLVEGRQLSTNERLRHGLPFDVILELKARGYTSKHR